MPDDRPSTDQLLKRLSELKARDGLTEREKETIRLCQREVEERPRVVVIGPDRERVPLCSARPSSVFEHAADGGYELLMQDLKSGIDYRITLKGRDTIEEEPRRFSDSPLASHE